MNNSEANQQIQQQNQYNNTQIKQPQQSNIQNNISPQPTIISEGKARIGQERGNIGGKNSNQVQDILSNIIKQQQDNMSTTHLLPPSNHDIQSQYIYQNVNQNHSSQQHQQERKEPLTQLNQNTDNHRNHNIIQQANITDFSNQNSQFNPSFNYSQQQQAQPKSPIQILQNQYVNQQIQQHQTQQQQNVPQFSNPKSNFKESPLFNNNITSRDHNLRNQPNSAYNKQANLVGGNENSQPLNQYSQDKIDLNMSKDKYQQDKYQQNQHQFIVDGQQDYNGQNQIQQRNQMQNNKNQTNSNISKQFNDTDEESKVNQIKYQQNQQLKNNYMHQDLEELDKGEDSQNEECDSEQNQDLNIEDSQQVMTNRNVNNNESQQSQQAQVESFKLEIERRYQKSQMNFIYKFPKEQSSTNSIDSESSLISLANVELYDLNIQNFQGMKHQQNSRSQNQGGSNNINSQNNQNIQKSQNEQKSNEGKSMKVCLSERNLNHQIKNNNNSSTSFIASNQNQIPSMNTLPIPNTSQNKLKLQQQPPLPNSQNQQNINFINQSNQYSQNQSSQNNNGQVQKTLKKNEQTKSFSDLRATQANYNNISNSKSNIGTLNKNTESIQNQLNQGLYNQSNVQIQNQNKTGLVYQNNGVIQNQITNGVQHQQDNLPVQIQQNQNNFSLSNIQNNQQQVQQQFGCLQQDSQYQNQGQFQMNQNLNKTNSQENLTKMNNQQNSSSNSYYLTERWKKDGNNQSVQSAKNTNSNTNYNQIISNLSKTLRQQDSKTFEGQFQENSNLVNNEQFLNVNQLLEKSGHLALAGISSNNISTKNVNQSQLQINNFIQQSNNNTSMSQNNNKQVNQLSDSKKQNLKEDNVNEMLAATNKNENINNRSRLYQDIELQNRIMKMKLNLDEKLRSSTSRSNEKINSTSHLNQKPHSQDIFSKMKAIIQNDTFGNNSLSQRNTQSKDKYDTSKSFETKKGGINSITNNENMSLNNIKNSNSSNINNTSNYLMNNGNNTNTNSNSSQNIQNFKQFKATNVNNQKTKQLERNSSTKQLTNKSQSKEKQSSNSKSGNNQVNLSSHTNLLASSNKPQTQSSSNNFSLTPQSQANKQISMIMNTESSYINSSSRLQNATSNSLTKQNSTSKIKSQQNQSNLVNISSSKQNYNGSSNQTINQSNNNYSGSNFNNGTTSTTTTASNTNSTINPQSILIQNQKSPQGLSQQVQNAIAGLKTNQNNQKDQSQLIINQVVQKQQQNTKEYSNNDLGQKQPIVQKEQNQQIISEVIQKQIEQANQNKMNSYKSSGSLLKNYSNSNLQVQTCRNQPKNTNIRDIRLKLNEGPQSGANTLNHINNYNNNSFSKKDISLGASSKNYTQQNIQTLQTQNSQKNLLQPATKSTNNLYSNIQEANSSQNNTINKSLINSANEVSFIPSNQKQSQQTANNTSRIQNTSREREMGTYLQQHQLQMNQNLPQSPFNQGISGQQFQQQSQSQITQTSNQILNSGTHQNNSQSTSCKQNTIQLKNLLQQQQYENGFSNQNSSMQQNRNTTKEEISLIQQNKGSTNSTNINSSYFLQNQKNTNSKGSLVAGSGYNNLQSAQMINKKSPSKLSLNQGNMQMKETHSPQTKNPQTNSSFQKQGLHLQQQQQQQQQQQINQQQGSHTPAGSSKANLLQQIMQKTVKSGTIKTNNYIVDNEQQYQQEDTQGQINKSLSQYKKAVEINLLTQPSQQQSQSQQQQQGYLNIKSNSQLKQNNFDLSPLRNVNKSNMNGGSRQMNNTANSYQQYLNNSNSNQSFMNAILNGSQNNGNTINVHNSTNNIHNSTNNIHNSINNIHNSTNITQNNNNNNTSIPNNISSNVQKNSYLMNDNYIKGLTKNFSSKQITQTNNQYLPQQRIENKQLLQSTEFNNSKTNIKQKDITNQNIQSIHKQPTMLLNKEFITDYNRVDMQQKQEQQLQGYSIQNHKQQQQYLQ